MTDDHEVTIAEPAADARWRCADLLIEFWQNVDSGHATRNRGFFCGDADWVVTRASDEGLATDLHGIDEISAWCVAREKRLVGATRHFCGNMLFKMLSSSEISASSLVLFLRLDRPDGSLSPSSIIEYQDFFVKEADGEWRFSKRTGRVVIESS